MLENLKTKQCRNKRNLNNAKQEEICQYFFDKYRPLLIHLYFLIKQDSLQKIFTCLQNIVSIIHFMFAKFHQTEKLLTL